MTMQEYYEALKERWEQIDKNSKAAIHEYNEWKRVLRQMVDEDE